MIISILVARVFLSVADWTPAAADDQCSGNNRTAYLRTENLQVQRFDRNFVTLADTSLDSCLSRCSTTNVVNSGSNQTLGQCASLEYSSTTKTCVLNQINGQPFGPGILTQAVAPGLSFYQKICIQSEQLCTVPFERIPMHVLIGHALEVHTTSSVSQCLSDCLESSTKFGTDCLSALFFYDTNECILNAVDRRSRPDLFSGDTQGYIVDYFENNCAQLACSPPRLNQYVKVEDRALQHDTFVTVPNVDLKVCQYLCTHNQNLAGERVFCKSFVFQPARRNCQLFSERSTPLGSSALVPTAGSDYFEKVCTSAPQACGREAVFVRQPLHILVGHAEEVTEVSTLNDCLDQCLTATMKSAFHCTSAMYFYETFECILNTANRQKVPELFSSNTKGLSVDYFDNTCYNNPGMCSNNEVRQYIKVTGRHLEGRSIIVAAPAGDSAIDCLESCTNESRFPCRSVEYSIEGCKPSHQNADFNTLTSATKPVANYYEARCFNEQDAKVCIGSVYAFLLYPDHQIQAYSIVQVLERVTPDGCLSACLQQLQRCVSVNYNKQLLRCELLGDGLRTLGVAGANLESVAGIDYYENQCSVGPIFCQFQLIVSAQRIQDAFRMFRLSVPNLAACQDLCSNERRIFCRSISFNIASPTDNCLLSDVSRDILLSYGEDLNLTEPAHEFEYYERICGNAVSRVSPSESPGGAPSSVVNTGLASTNQNTGPVSTNQIGAGGGVTTGSSSSSSFGNEPTIVGAASSPNFPPVLVSAVNNGTITSTVDIAGTPAAAYTTIATTTSNNNSGLVQTTRFAEPKLAVDKNPGSVIVAPSATTVRLPDTFSIAFQTAATPVETRTTTVGSSFASFVPSGNISGVQIDCRNNGVQITVRFREPTSGSIFPRNKFTTCVEQFREIDVVSFDILRTQSSNLASGHLDCGGEELASELYLYTIILQTNAYGVPGLVTADDQIYNVTCDYSQLSSHSGSSPGSGSGDPNSIGVGRGTGSDSGSGFRSGSGHEVDVKNAVVIELERRGKSASSVLLGEVVNLKWKVVEDVPEVDYFIRNCYAERVGGATPPPEPLAIIVDGCPPPAIQSRIILGPIRRSVDGFVAPMRVFRFDGSKSVMIHCLIDMCHHACEPETCFIGNETSFSMGRRRRRNSLEPEPLRGNYTDLHFASSGSGVGRFGSGSGAGALVFKLPASNGAATATKKQKPKQKVLHNGEVVKVFSIVDQLPNSPPETAATTAAVATPVDDANKTPPISFSRHKPDIPPLTERNSVLTSASGQSVLIANGRICLYRPTFVGMFAFLSLLCVAELFAILSYICCKLRRHPTAAQLQHSSVATRRARKAANATTTDGSSAAYVLSVDPPKQQNQGQHHQRVVKQHNTMKTVSTSDGSSKDMYQPSTIISEFKRQLTSKWLLTTADHPAPPAAGNSCGNGNNGGKKASCVVRRHHRNSKAANKEDLNGTAAAINRVPSIAKSDESPSEASSIVSERHLAKDSQRLLPRQAPRSDGNINKQRATIVTSALAPNSNLKASPVEEQQQQQLYSFSTKTMARKVLYSGNAQPKSVHQRQLQPVLQNTVVNCSHGAVVYHVAPATSRPSSSGTLDPAPSTIRSSHYDNDGGPRIKGCTEPMVSAQDRGNTSSNSGSMSNEAMDKLSSLPSVPAPMPRLGGTGSAFGTGSGTSGSGLNIRMVSAFCPIHGHQPTSWAENNNKNRSNSGKVNKDPSRNYHQPSHGAERSSSKILL